MHTMLPTDVLASTIAADRTRTLQSAARRHRLTHGVTIRKRMGRSASSVDRPASESGRPGR